jgi:hypothetical protein
MLPDSAEVIVGGFVAYRASASISSAKICCLRASASSTASEGAIEVSVAMGRSSTTANDPKVLVETGTDEDGVVAEVEGVVIEVVVVVVVVMIVGMTACIGVVVAATVGGTLGRVNRKIVGLGVGFVGFSIGVVGWGEGATIGRVT